MGKTAFVLMQMDIAFGRPEKNNRHVQELFAQAGLKEDDIAVLPELWNTGYDLNRLPEIADAEGKSTLAMLGELAKKYQVPIIGGSVARRKNGRYYNTTFVVDKQGELLAGYSKVHLFRLMQEEKYFSPGNHRQTYLLNDCEMGAGICYDLRFPEFFRRQACDGAEIFVVPAQWPKQRLHPWRTLLQARAIENQAFVVGVNRVGADPDNEFNGHSMVAGPDGEVLLELGEKEEIARIEVDTRRIFQLRKEIPVFKDRRPEVY